LQSLRCWWPLRQCIIQLLAHLRAIEIFGNIYNIYRTCKINFFFALNRELLFQSNSNKRWKIKMFLYNWYILVLLIFDWFYLS
jgi:hypothetical protein